MSKCRELKAMKKITVISDLRMKIKTVKGATCVAVQCNKFIKTWILIVCRRLGIHVWVRYSLCLWYGSEDRHKYTISMKSAKCEKNYVQYDIYVCVSVCV